ncbi:UNVERIFIED_CONTAM: Ribonuclease HI [Sesamum radiatum]|uniref:Ribonuclease HI n=1 Tax=Sesamum radiatum TaxID=300843 RepID=A0AAW2R0S5_SESRA
MSNQEGGNDQGKWLHHVDGSSNSTQGEQGLVLRDPEGIKFEVAVKLNFIVTNNEVEYEAVIARMNLAMQLGAKDVVAHTNSQLVAQQFGRTYEVKETSMFRYLQKVRDLQLAFENFELHQVPRKENERADALSKFASATSGIKSRKITLLVSEHPKKRDFHIIKSLEMLWKTNVSCYLTFRHLMTNGKP